MHPKQGKRTVHLHERPLHARHAVDARLVGPQLLHALGPDEARAAPCLPGELEVNC